MKLSSHAVTRRRAWTRFLAAPVAALTGLVIVVPLMQPAGASPVKATSRVRPGTFHDHIVLPSTRITGTIQKELFNFAKDFAAGSLLGFAFSDQGLAALLGGGDNTSAKLDELTTKMDQISIDIHTLQSSANLMSTEASQAALEGFTADLTPIISSIQSLYADFLVPALDALATYVAKDLEARIAGTTCDEVPACVTARQAYLGNPKVPNDIGRRQEFLNRFNQANGADLNITMHNFLMPGPAKGSLMSAYGLYLAKTAYAGTVDVDDTYAIQDFYNYYANYEALAAWMKAMWDSTRLDASGFAKFLDVQITQYQDDEHAALPPPIPVGTVIQLPADAALRTNDTYGKPMWAPPEQIWGLSNALTPWPPDLAEPPVIQIMNSSSDPRVGFGLKGWRVPSRNEVDGLLSAAKAQDPTQTGDAFLYALTPSWATLLHNPGLMGVPAIWTTQPAGNPSSTQSPAIACQDFSAVTGGYIKFATVTGYEHTGVYVLPSLSQFPAKFYTYNSPPLGITHVDLNFTHGETLQQKIDKCKAVIAADVASAISSNSDYGVLIAIRTADRNYLP